MASQLNFDLNRTPFDLVEDTLANPALGAGFTQIVVPAGQIWVIESIYYELVTSVVVANRNASLAWFVAGSAVNYSGIQSFSTAQTANATWRITWSLSALTNTTNWYHTNALGLRHLFPSQRLQVIYSGLDPGDQLQNFRYLYRRYKV